jgi:putative transposase
MLLVNNYKCKHMTTYPSDLSDSQWQVIEPFLSDKRKRKYTYKALLNAIFYLVKTGCQWRMLPSDYPKWQSVYFYFSRWKREGTLEQIQLALVEKIRTQAGKKAEPTAAIIDAQSVKTTLVGGEARGFDGGKKVKGTKRHIVVDTMGLVLMVVIHSAGLQDRDGAREVLTALKGLWVSIIKVFADGGYRGKLVEWVKQKLNYELRIIKRDELHSFKVLPRRWIVERTFAWLDTNRRSSKDYERLIESSQAMTHLAAIRIMLLKS